MAHTALRRGGAANGAPGARVVRDVAERALRHLQEHNVFCIVLPSHTTIWSQPNDAGTNRAVHKVLQEMLSKWTGVHRRPQHTKITLDVWNGLFVEGWAKFVDDQHDQLKVDGTSNIVKGWENVGLITGKIADSAFWKHAVATLGQIGDISSGSAAAVDTTAAGVSAWLLKVNRDRTAGGSSR